MEESRAIGIRYTEDEQHFSEGLDLMPGAALPGKTRRNSFVIGGVVGLGVVGGLMLLDRENDPLWFVPPVALILMLVYVWYWSFSRGGQRRSTLKELKKTLPVPRPEVWSVFSESGFLSTGSNGRSTHYPWKTIDHVILIPEGLYVFVDKATMFWFPKRLFDNKNEFEETARYVRDAEVPFERMNSRNTVINS